MTAALGPWIMRHPDVSSNMEQFLLQFVTPEFSSAEGYMRAIVRFSSFSTQCLRFAVLGLLLLTFVPLLQACEVLGTFTKEGLKWSSDEVRGRIPFP
jgi:hypothetical protein